MVEERGVYRVFVGKPEERRPLGRPRRRWVDNIRMDLQEVGCGYMEWIGLAQDRDRYYHKCDPYRSALGPPSPLYHGYRVSFPRVKRPRRRVDRLPPSSAKVKERVQLYFYSPSGPSRPVLGPIYPYLLLYNISNITQYM